MNYRKLTGTELEISELGMGCSSYWAKEEFSESEALGLLRNAFDSGINFFDTGSSYAEGNAEKRLGKFLKSIDSTKVIISSKAGTVSTSMGSATKNFSIQSIKSSIDSSLERLGRSYIDILFLHSPRIEDITDELLQGLHGIKKSGKIRYFGIHSSRAEVIEYSLKYDVFRVFLSDYNVMRAGFEVTIDRVFKDGKGFIAATPLAQMLFTNRVFLPKSFKDLWYLARALKNRRKQLVNGLKLRFINRYKDYSSEEIALNFVLDNEHVCSAVFGTTQQKNLLKNVNAVRKSIPDHIFQRIRQVNTLYEI